MTSIPSWELLSVQAFFGQVNWQGLPPAPVQVAQKNQPPLQEAMFDRQAQAQSSSSEGENPLRHWPTLTLEAFFAQSNWSGLSLPAPLPLPVMLPEPDQEMSGATPSQDSLAWPRLSVESFFSGVNWHGTMASSSPVSDRSDRQEEASPFRWSVSDFMKFIPWEGHPAIAALPPRDAIPPSTRDEITLTDLSNLF